MFGKSVRFAESLVPCRPHAACHVHLPLDRIRPHPLRGSDVVAQACQHADVQHRQHQRDAVHRMADRFTLLQHRLVGLVVPAPADRILEPADIEIVFCQIEVLLLVRCAIQLHAVERIPLAAVERRVVYLEVFVQRRSSLDRRLQQIPLPRRLEVCDRRLEAAIPGHPGRRDLLDARVHLALQVWVRVSREREDRRLEDVAGKAPAVALLNLERNRDLSIGRDLRFPEAVRDLYFRVALRLNRIVLDGRVGRAGNRDRYGFRLRGRRGRGCRQVCGDSSRCRRRFQKITTSDYAHEPLPQECPLRSAGLFTFGPARTPTAADSSTQPLSPSTVGPISVRQADALMRR